MMNPSNYKTNAEEGHGRHFKKELALAKASKAPPTSAEHVVQGTLTEQPSYRTMMDEHGYEQHCNEYEIYANWDDEKLIHLVHTIRPWDTEKVNFPSSKPMIFTGCFMEGDNQEIHPITAKLSFHKEKGEPKLIARGNMLMYFDNYEVKGWATKMKNTEYRIELRASPAHGVGG